MDIGEKEWKIEKRRERKKQIGKKENEVVKEGSREGEAKSKLHSTSWKRWNGGKKTEQDEQHLKTRDWKGWVFGEEKPESEGWGQREI